MVCCVLMLGGNFEHQQVKLEITDLGLIKIFACFDASLLISSRANSMDITTKFFYYFSTGEDDWNSLEKTTTPANSFTWIQ